MFFQKTSTLFLHYKDGYINIFRKKFQENYKKIVFCLFASRRNKFTTENFAI
jgi:hypothetical protein